MTKANDGRRWKIMEKVIGFCGIVCDECPALLATQKNDDNERKRVAEQWSRQYSADIKPEDVNCDGCLSESGRLFGYCKVCEIRKCGREKRVKNCAYCDEYACEKLNQFFVMAPNAKVTLEEIRKKPLI
jgi:hypothetical protein